MNNQLQVFENEEFGKVRVLEIDGQPLFVGKDVTDILGYGNGSRDINRHVDAEDCHCQSEIHQFWQIRIPQLVVKDLLPVCKPVAFVGKIKDLTSVRESVE